jgi:hypothetical protein
MTGLDELLGRLDEMPRRTASYRGRAIGKDSNNLHLAVPTGVIAIPLAAITEIRELKQAGMLSDVVRVEVSDPAGVVQLQRVSPFRPDVQPNDTGTNAAGKTPSADDASSYTWTAHHVETVTVTGGDLDATDDGDDGFHPDEDVVQAPEPIWL